MEIRGGILPFRDEQKMLAAGVQVSWSWYNQAQGTVKWTFDNPGNSTASFLLLRNAYYFGNAFWPVYLNNKQFNESFSTDASPLKDAGVTGNSAPLAVVQFPDGRYIVCFVFTLSAGQSWSMLEGGFSASFPPSAFSAVSVKYSTTTEYCISYDPKQVSDWDSQTGTSYQGYTPNPSSFNVSLFLCSGSYVSLFMDKVSKGQCP